MMSDPINDNHYMRRGPRLGECGLRAEDTGLDMWLSNQYENGEPSLILKIIAVQVWERSTVNRLGFIPVADRTAFLSEIGLTDIDLVNALERYGWVMLSHHGPRK